MLHHLRPTILLSVLVCALFYLFVFNAESVTYWVSLTGGSTASACNDADGTSDPNVYFRTIPLGIACLTSPGDILMIKNGTYPSSTTNRCDNCFPANGTPSNPIVIRAQNFGQVTWEQPSGAQAYTLTFNGRNHIKIQGIKFNGLTNSNHSAIVQLGFDAGSAGNPGTGIIFEDNEFYNCSSSCFIGGTLYTGTIWRRNTFHDIFARGSGANLTAAVYIRQRGVLFEHNLVYDALDSPDAISAACIQFTQSSGNNLDQATDAVIRYNRLFHCEGHGIYIGNSTNVQVYDNLIYDVDLGCITTQENMNGLQIYNNTLDQCGQTSSAYAAIRPPITSTSAEGVIANNLILRSGAGGAISSPMAAGFVLKNNLTSGTASSVWIAPDAALASRNYNLASTTGVDTGTKAVCDAGDVSAGRCNAVKTLAINGSEKDQGAFEAPVFSSCAVEAATPSVVNVLFQANQGNTLTGSVGANWTRTGTTTGNPSTITPVGSTRVDVTLTATVTAGQTISLAYTRPSSAMLRTSTQLIGNTEGAVVRSFTAQVCTNRTSGASVATFEQVRFGWFDAFGKENNGRSIFGSVENTTLTVPPISCLALRLKLRCNGANCDPKSVVTRYSKNAGGFTNAVPDTLGVDQITYQLCPNMQDGEPTTERLASGAGGFVAGTIRGRQSAIDNIDLAQNDETEFVDCLCISGATPTDTYQFRLYDQAGTALNTYTATPQLTIGPYRAIWK